MGRSATTTGFSERHEKIYEIMNVAGHQPTNKSPVISTDHSFKICASHGRAQRQICIYRPTTTQGEFLPLQTLSG